MANVTSETFRTKDFEDFSCFFVLLLLLLLLLREGTSRQQNTLKPLEIEDLDDVSCFFVLLLLLLLLLLLRKGSRQPNTMALKDAQTQNRGIQLPKVTSETFRKRRF